MCTRFELTISIAKSKNKLTTPTTASTTQIENENKNKRQITLKTKTINKFHSLQSKYKENTENACEILLIKHYVC